MKITEAFDRIIEFMRENKAKGGLNVYGDIFEINLEIGFSKISFEGLTRNGVSEDLFRFIIENLKQSNK